MVLGAGLILMSKVPLYRGGRGFDRADPAFVLVAEVPERQLHYKTATFLL